MLYQVPRPRKKVEQKVVELCSFQNFLGSEGLFQNFQNFSFVQCYFTCPFLKSPDHLSLCVHFYFTFFVRYFNSALSLKNWVCLDIGPLHDSGILHFTSPINETTIESTMRQQMDFLLGNYQASY
ncbi:hypothetical protein SO802_028493 [Lithocarpus litseifolius]|uniref:Uncharacterized protein n=1 Tax=Lithocarpus litseifolius TaxID=425828 RepID=A0AAW2BQG7_9ROSI